MREFWVRVVCVMVVVGTLLGYNMVLDSRAKEETIAKLTAQAETQSDAASEEDAGGSEETGAYQDGVYNGEAEGFGGTISVDVTIEDQQITAVDVISAEGEDGAYLETAKDIIPLILEAQSTDVDTVSGATFSSTGIRDACAQALEKAVQ